MIWMVKTVSSTMRTLTELAFSERVLSSREIYLESFCFPLVLPESNLYFVDLICMPTWSLRMTMLLIDYFVFLLIVDIVWKFCFGSSRLTCLFFIYCYFILFGGGQ